MKFEYRTVRKSRFVFTLYIRAGTSWLEWMTGGKSGINEAIARFDDDFRARWVVRYA
tara:strand:- start:1156 stop:1326 length:171 start_codon:yes stop_codon:yes gene_type:complete